MVSPQRNAGFRLGTKIPTRFKQKDSKYYIVHPFPVSCGQVLGRRNSEKPISFQELREESAVLMH